MAKTKGGGTKKVCLPASKVSSMSQSEKSRVVSAKRSAAAKGDYKRSSKSNVKGARKKGATLRDWFEKENWVQVSNGKPCGASMKKPTACGASMKKSTPCWDGFIKKGLKKKGNRMVNNCVKVGGASMRKTTKGPGRTFFTSEEGAGMTKKGVSQYRKENPGSKLKTAVTGKVKPGSKAAKRRKSFCARSKSWTGERGKAARRRWKC